MESKVVLDNIKCNGCVKSVTDVLTSIKGVESVKIDIPTGEVEIEHEKESDLDIMLEKLEEAGYPEK